MINDNNKLSTIKGFHTKMLLFVIYLKNAWYFKRNKFINDNDYFFKIVPNIWTIHHSEKEFDEPFVFKPERFLDEKGHLLPSNDPVRKRYNYFDNRSTFFLLELIIGITHSDLLNRYIQSMAIQDQIYSHQVPFGYISHYLILNNLILIGLS